MSVAKVKNLFRQLFKNPYFWALLLGIASLHIVREFAYMRRSAPPPMVYVGDWSLTNHEGKIFGSKDLKGKVYIASFFFTSCPTICPKITKEMIEVQKRFTKLTDKVGFISITVDPDTDTPEVMTAYRQKNNITNENWNFLTGKKAEIFQVVAEHMKLFVGEREEFKDTDTDKVLYNISHVAELALFDQNGDLRGKFPTDPTSLAALERAAKFLVEKGP